MANHLADMAGQQALAGLRRQGGGEPVWIAAWRDQATATDAEPVAAGIAQHDFGAVEGEPIGSRAQGGPGEAGLRDDHTALGRDMGHEGGIAAQRRLLEGGAVEQALAQGVRMQAAVLRQQPRRRGVGGADQGRRRRR